MSNTDAELANLSRLAAIYLEKYERYDSQELLSYGTMHWLMKDEGYHTGGSETCLDSPLEKAMLENRAVILFPVNDSVAPFCYRELHTIVRELTMGMYVFNQTPIISLEANYDQATICNLPPAYLDTRVGQVLTNVDYMLKGLWHGAYFPKERRMKFNERWRASLDVNLLGKPETKKPFVTEFVNSGLMDVTKDPDFMKMYDWLPVDIPDDAEMSEERNFFMSNVDNLTMKLTFTPDNMQNYQNLFIFNAKYHVSSIVRMMDNQIDQAGYERLKTRLQMHENTLQDNIAAKQDIRRQLELLKFICCLMSFFVEIAERMKIPDVQKLFQPFSSEECLTEREFPPLIVGPEFKCKNFKYTGTYFNLHGGIAFDVDRKMMTDASEGFTNKYQSIMEKAGDEFYNIFNPDQPAKEFYNVPVCTVEGKQYYMIIIEMEPFVGSSPQTPLWVRAFNDEMDKIRPKRLPITDIHMHEQFKRNFGYKKAIKFKTPIIGIKVCAQCGLVAMFTALSRKVLGSRLGRHDEQGLTLLHHAAMFNRPQIIIRMIINSVDVNLHRNNIMAIDYKKAVMALGKSSSTEIVIHKQTRSMSMKSCDGPTALHTAARCGSLDVVSCLVYNEARIAELDQDGWAPIHYAASYDHQIIVTFMTRKEPSLLELKTSNSLEQTPLLLAASFGALSVLKCLIDLEAEIAVEDTEGNNLVVLAALRFHTNILHYLIELNHPNVMVWDILVEMLAHESIIKKDASVKCLEVLSTMKPKYWEHIRDSGGVPALVKLLSLDNMEIQLMAASALCNMSEQNTVRIALSEAGAIPVLINLLSSSVYDILSRACIILADITRIGNNQNLITEHGGVMPLVALLDLDMEDVLINVVNVIRVLCFSNPTNQRAVAECGGLEPLVEFLDVSSDDLQAGAAATLASVTSKNTENQDHVILLNVHKPLVELIKNSKSTLVQVKAASALEALATNNVNSQNCFLQLDAPKALIRLLKNVHVEVREQGACSLWSLAGNTRTQHKYIAERISIPHIIQMLLEPTEKLLYVGCMTAIALGMENMVNQNKLAAAEAIPQLVSLLRSPKTSEKVLHMVIKVLGILCVGVAFRNNKMTQRKIADEGGIGLLAGIYQNCENEEIQVEVAITLGCVTLSFKENQHILAEEPRFSYEILPNLLRLKDHEMKLRAGMALTIFAFNNTPQQMALRHSGIKYSIFKKFIESTDEFYQCYAAFQIVVLARVIIDRNQIELTAQGIELLVAKIESTEDKVTVLACNLLSSLSHTRAGLADAMVSVGVLDLLVKKLQSQDVMVRNGAAVALGYLTYNKTAYRLLFTVCRNIPGLYSKIILNIGDDPKINPIFMADFKKATEIGMPSQFLEINMGKPLQENKPFFQRKSDSSDTTRKKMNSNSSNPGTFVYGEFLNQNANLTLPQIWVNKSDLNQTKYLKSSMKRKLTDSSFLPKRANSARDNIIHGNKW